MSGQGASALTRPTALTASAFGGGGGFAGAWRPIGRRCRRGWPRRAEHLRQARDAAVVRLQGLPATPSAAVPDLRRLRHGPAARAVRVVVADAARRPGAPDAAYAIGNDGYVRALNVQSGWDMFPPVQFLPANTRPAGAIVVNDETTGFSMRSRRTAAPTRRTPSGPSI